MKLTEIVSSGAIVANLKAAERDGAVVELIDALVGTGSARPEARDELIAILLERERKSTTGFGAGIAVPHAKHKSVRRVCAAVGLAPGGLDFASIDMQPVYSVVLLLSPDDKPEEHLQAMEAVFKVLSQETFRRLLRQAASADEVRALLEETDAQHV
ncbi:MAG: PTS sugar transporter subunit IIA [Phycisphaerales bacterium]|nr:PTS sugar transporter subunit IIA [Phycisphaerales bacterium]